jgi:hypothetical protein
MFRNRLSRNGEPKSQFSRGGTHSPIHPFEDLSTGGIPEGREGRVSSSAHVVVATR